MLRVGSLRCGPSCVRLVRRSNSSITAGRFNSMNTSTGTCTSRLTNVEEISISSMRPSIVHPIQSCRIYYENSTNLITPPFEYQKNCRYFASTAASSSNSSKSINKKVTKDQIQKRYESLLHSVHPRRDKFNDLLWDLGKFQKQPWAAEYACNLLERMWKNYHEDMDEKVMPSTGNYKKVINLCVKSPDVDSVKKAIEYHEELEEKYETIRNKRLRPDVSTYTSLIDALVKSGHKGAGEKAEAILNKMQDRYEAGDKSLKPNLRMINSVINCWAKEGNGSRAEAIVGRMEDLRYQKGKGHLLVRPNTVTYNTLIDAWANSGEKGAGKRAEEILNKMQEQYEAGDVTVKPKIRSINSVVNCWAKEGNAVRAQAIVDHMEKIRHQKGHTHLRPNSITYNILMNAWSRSGEEGAGEKAESILNKMLDQYEAGDKHCRPDNRLFGAVLNCWAKEGNGTRAEAIVEYMEKLTNQKGYGNRVRPDKYTYTILVTAWSRSDEVGAFDKVKSIINMMEEKYEAGNRYCRPDIRTYNTLMNMWAREGNVEKIEALINHVEKLMHQKGYEHLHPDTFFYNILMNAWAKSGIPGAGEKAEALLDDMQRKYKAGDTNIQPSIRTFGAVLNCWAQEGNGKRSEAIINNMEELMNKKGFEHLRPTKFTYNILIDAWSRSGEDGVGEKAEAILNKMQQKYEAGDMNVKPDIRAINSVLNCWAKEGNIARAQAIVDHIEQLIQKEDDVKLRPTSVTYTILIDAWSRSGDKTAGEKAEAVIEHMKELRHKKCYEHLEPDSFTYTAVIDAWASSGEKGADDKIEDILNMCQEKFEAGDTLLKPRIRTFGSLVNYWAKNGNKAKAEAIIERTEHFFLDQVGHNSLVSGIDLSRELINIWSSKNTDEKEAVEEALAVLKKMQDLRL